VSNFVHFIIDRIRDRISIRATDADIFADRIVERRSVSFIAAEFLDLDTGHVLVGRNERRPVYFTFNLRAYQRSGFVYVVGLARMASILRLDQCRGRVGLRGRLVRDLHVVRFRVVVFLLGDQNK
jgi:hypothetical protein